MAGVVILDDRLPAMVELTRDLQKHLRCAGRGAAIPKPAIRGGHGVSIWPHGLYRSADTMLNSLTRGPSTIDAAGFSGYRVYSFFGYPRAAEGFV